MWHILKAELNYYYKLPLIITICIIMWLFIAFSIWGESHLEEDLLSFMIVAMSVTGVSYFYMILDKSKTKRERFHAVLPVSIGHVGISRLISVIVFWLIVAISLSLTLVTVRHDIKVVDIIWRLISFNGVIIFFNADYALSRDLYYLITRKNKTLGIHNDMLPIVILPLVNALVLLFFAIPHAFHINIPVREQLVNVMFSIHGAITLNLVGIGLSMLSVVIYAKRRSFLT